MEHTPRVDDVVGSEPGHILLVEDRSLLDYPVGTGSALTAQLGRCRHRIRVEVKRTHLCAKLVRGEREQPAATPDVEEPAARQVGDTQRFGQGTARCVNSRLVERSTKDFQFAPKAKRVPVAISSWLSVIC